MRFLAAIVAAGLLLAGCGGKTDKPSPSQVAKCETAMRQQYQHALSDQAAPSASRPAECDGVDAATLQQLAGKIIAEVTPTPDQTTSCKTALEESVRRYVASDQKSSTEMPTECNGLDEQTYEHLVDEVAAQANGG